PGIGGQGHVVARRGGRNSFGVAAQVAASSAGPGIRTTGRHEDDPRGRTAARRHQSGPGPRGRRERISQRFILPLARIPAACTGFARPARGHTHAGPPFRRKMRGPTAQADRGHPRGSLRSDDALELAGKHPRVGEFYRTLGDPFGGQLVEPAARRVARGNLTTAVRTRRYAARPGTRTHYRNSASDPRRLVGPNRRGSPAWTQAHHITVQDAATGNLTHGLSAVGLLSCVTSCRTVGRRSALRHPLWRTAHPNYPKPFNYKKLVHIKRMVTHVHRFVWLIHRHSPGRMFPPAKFHRPAGDFRGHAPSLSDTE